MISDIGPLENQTQSAYVKHEVYKDHGSDSLMIAMNLRQRKEEPYKKSRPDVERRKQERAAAEKASTKEPFGNGLKIRDHEIAIIHRIINYMDSKSTLALGWPSHQKFLIGEGNKVHHVHPLCFIWAIIIDPSLKRKVKSFRDDSMFALKWNGFLGYSPFHDRGFARNLERFYNHRDPKEFIKELDSFYEILNLKPEVLNRYAVKKDWRGFSGALFDGSSYK